MNVELVAKEMNENITKMVEREAGLKVFIIIII